MKAGINNNRAGHIVRTIARIKAQIGGLRADRIAHDRVVPIDLTCQPFGVRIKQKLVGVEPVSLFGRIGAVHAVAIACARRQSGDIDVPDIAVPLKKLDARNLVAARLIEKTKLDLLGMFREHRKVDALAIKGRPDRRRAPRRHGVVSEGLGQVVCHVNVHAVILS